MNDPIGAYNKVRENFIRYVKTAFATRFSTLEAERERLLRSTGNEGGTTFTTEPFIEPRPSYKPDRPPSLLSGSDLPGFSDDEVKDVAEFLRSGLFREWGKDDCLFAHQTQMLRVALAQSKAVITAGTGSGKTESFLMPILATLVKESRGWGKPLQKRPMADCWWQPRHEAWRAQEMKDRRSPRIPQREHEHGARSAAMRALIIYPMNALVEDQMTRLRKALDSAEARAWFAAKRGGNAFYFGRFNSNSPVSGLEMRPGKTELLPNRDKIKELAEQLQDSRIQAALQHGDTASLANPSPAACRFCALRPGCKSYCEARQARPDAEWPNDVWGKIETKTVSSIGLWAACLSDCSVPGEKAVIRRLSCGSRHSCFQKAALRTAIAAFGLRKEGGSETYAESPTTVVYSLA